MSEISSLILWRRCVLLLLRIIRPVFLRPVPLRLWCNVSSPPLFSPSLLSRVARTDGLQRTWNSTSLTTPTRLTYSTHSSELMCFLFWTAYQAETGTNPAWLSLPKGVPHAKNTVMGKLNNKWILIHTLAVIERCCSMKLYVKTSLFCQRVSPYLAPDFLNCSYLVSHANTQECS